MPPRNRAITTQTTTTTTVRLMVCSRVGQFTFFSSIHDSRIYRRTCPTLVARLVGAGCLLKLATLPDIFSTISFHGANGGTGTIGSTSRAPSVPDRCADSSTSHSSGAYTPRTLGL